MRFGASRTTTLVRWPFSLMLTPLSLMSRSSVPLPVRGHEKVPIGGQVAVPVGGQLKSPLFVRRVVVVEVLPRLTVTVSAITGAAEGDLHCEERGGTDGCDGGLSGCGRYWGGAAIWGTNPKTVKRIIEAQQAGQAPGRKSRGRNFDQVKDLVVERVEKTAGRISAKRLLPQARAAGYAGSARNFRRLVAQVKAGWRQGQHRGRRPGVWTPAETLIIDWGVEAGFHVFFAGLAWSRFRFVRFAADEKAATTFGLLAECFEQLGGVPKTVL